MRKSTFYLLVLVMIFTLGGSWYLFLTLRSDATEGQKQARLKVEEGLANYKKISKETKAELQERTAELKDARKIANEAESLRATVAGLRKQLKDEEALVEELRKDREAARKKITELSDTSMVLRLQEEASSLRRALDNARDQVARLKEDRLRIQAEAARDRKTAENVSRELEVYLGEVDLLETRARTEKARVVDLHKEIARLNAVLEKQRIYITRLRRAAGESPLPRLDAPPPVDSREPLMPRSNKAREDDGRPAVSEPDGLDARYGPRLPRAREAGPRRPLRALERRDLRDRRDPADRPEREEREGSIWVPHSGEDRGRPRAPSLFDPEPGAPAADDEMETEDRPNTEADEETATGETPEPEGDMDAGEEDEPAAETEGETEGDGDGEAKESSTAPRPVTEEERLLLEGDRKAKEKDGAEK